MSPHKFLVRRKTVTVSPVAAGRSVFVVDMGRGNAHLYLALLDGDQSGLKAGEELTANFHLATGAAK